MVDVVAKLKLTPKGQLRYSSGSWSPVELLDERKQPSIHISPFSIQRSSKLAGVKASTNRNTDYKNYFSPERKEVETHHPIVKFSVQHKKRQCPSHTLQSRLSQRNESDLLHDVNTEYDEMLERMSRLRFEKMRSKLNNLDEEHLANLKTIEINALQNQAARLKSLLVEQSMQPTDEITDYETLSQQKNMQVAQKVKQAEKKIQDLELRAKKCEEEKKEKERRAKLNSLTQCTEPIKKIVSRVIEIVNKFKAASQAIPQNLTLLLGQVAKEHNECMSIISKAVHKQSQSLDDDIHQVTAKFKSLENLLKACEKHSQALEEKLSAEEKLRKEAAEKAKQAAATPPAVATSSSATSAAPSLASQSVPTVSSSVPVLSLPDNVSISTAAPDLAPLEATLRPILSLCCPKPAFLEYLRLRKLLLDVEKHHEPLNKATDKAKKTYKFDLYKVVNTTINAISDESPKHLLDKIIKVNTLFMGQDIEMSGKRINTKNGVEALWLCKDLLARKIVLQGESQVSSSFKTAFPIAAFAVGVWSLFPDVGDLLLAHFVSKCPYLVPFYMPKSKEMSTIDYCKLIGYEVTGQEVESEDKYLKRLSGVVRLYAAILQTELPPQLGNRNHPHGLEHGWVWFTRMLNLDPRPSVTATILFDFLEVAGHAMVKRYGNQFRKLLVVLCQDYLPKILQVTPNDSKATVMRLKMFLDTCIKDGKIKEPDGYLASRWWST